MNLSGLISSMDFICDPGNMKDEDLLSLILAGNCRFTRPIACELLRKAGGLAAIKDMSIEELMEIPGIGQKRAASIFAAFEIGRRALISEGKGVKLSCSRDVYEAMWPLMLAEDVEVFRCALLDTKLRMKKCDVISRGTLNASIVHPRDAFRSAVRSSAYGVIFVHNHPSGETDPSFEDRLITERLEKAGRIIGIPLLDHVIIGSHGEYFSFADAGLIDGDKSGYNAMVLR